MALNSKYLIGKNKSLLAPGGDTSIRYQTEASVGKVKDMKIIEDVDRTSIVGGIANNIPVKTTTTTTTTTSTTTTTTTATP